MRSLFLWGQAQILHEVALKRNPRNTQCMPACPVGPADRTGVVKIFALTRGIHAPRPCGQLDSCPIPLSCGITVDLEPRLNIKFEFNWAGKIERFSKVSLWAIFSLTLAFHLSIMSIMSKQSIPSILSICLLLGVDLLAVKRRYLKVDKDMFSIPQAAKYCAINRRTLWMYVKAGQLKASRTPGGHYRIIKEDLESFILEKEMYPLANNLSSSKKILIVDDDPQVQNVLVNILSRFDYKTEIASDGFEAGAKIMEFKPSLVILDLIMPGMDGFEVCRRLKENLATSHIKILAVSGYGTEGNKKRIMEAGADGYLAKPLRSKELLQNIEDLLYKQIHKLKDAKE
jgi:excisionase family DNA binding protein